MTFIKGPSLNVARNKYHLSKIYKTSENQKENKLKTYNFVKT